MVTRNELRERYRRVMDRVGEAAARSGRDASRIIVVAVTKLASPEQIRSLLELGHKDLGENRVQQLQQRAAMCEEFLSRHRLMSSGRKVELPDAVRWHMIGSLQRNKVKPVLPLVKLIHSVDTLRLAEEIQAIASRMDREVDVLLQVNVSGESSKHGVAPAAAGYMAEQFDTMMNIRLRGLMTIAPESDDPQASRSIFERAAELFHEIKEQGVGVEHFDILSMGMTNDFEVAIECGANMVRIGRALFDEGEPPLPVIPPVKRTARQRK